MTTFREQPLGATAVFLLPSLKLKEPARTNGSLEQRLHTFLMENFGGYTAQAGNIFGYWRDESGEDSYGEHREFTVALDSDDKAPVLKSFVAKMAEDLGEECIYLRIGGSVTLIYPDVASKSSGS